MRRFTKPLALLLAVVMIVGLLPVMAFAEDDNSVVVSDIETTPDYTPTEILAVEGVWLESSGNVLTIKTNEKAFNIHAIAIDRNEPEDFVALEDAPEDAVQVQGAKFENGFIGNLHREGAYATIDLDFVFADKPIEAGEHTIYFLYATKAEGVVLTVTPSYGDVAQLNDDEDTDDDNNVITPTTEETTSAAEETTSAAEETTPATEGTTPATEETTPATEETTLVTEETSRFTAPLMTASNPNGAMLLAEGSGYKKVTVTGIPNTGHWDPENYNDYLNIPEVYLSGSSKLTFTAVNGINISGIKIGDISVEFVNCKEAITLPLNNDSTRFENDYHIAWMDRGGFTIDLNKTSFATLSEGAYTVSVRYGTANGDNGTANLTVESSSGAEARTIAYSELTGGSTGGGYEENGTVIPVPDVQMDTQYIATFPDGAKWFFDADGEKKSFGTLDADTYRNDLPVNAETGKVQNDITLQSSTDGGIFNLPNNTKGNNGVFSIDWESGNYDHQKNVVPVGWGETGDKPQDTTYGSQGAVPSKHKISAAGYTDGSYTIVGWGGDFAANSDKNWLEIKLKDNEDGTLNDALSHLTIYTVGPYGAVYDKIYLGNTEFGGETDNLKLVSGPDTNGYYTYEAHLRGSKQAQGIKFAFDRTSDSNSRHSGTLLIEQVRVNMYGSKDADGFENQWQDFGPFAYGTNKDSYEQDPTDSDYLPFIRSMINNNGTGENKASGANREKGTGWLLWTMSTSDANIVSNYTSKTDALQIKYRHDTGNNILAPHTTFTELDGTKDLNANWLVMTLGTARYDASVMDMNVQLIDRNGGKQMIRLGDFVKSMDSGADKIDAEYINGKYQTVYYDLTQLQGFNGFRNIRFYFDDVTDNLGSGSRDSRFLYLTQVYLIGENATVYKEVDKTQAQAGDELTYTITVWNNGTVGLSSYTVNDVLPSGVEFKSITCNGSEFTNYTLVGSTLTLNGTDFTIGKQDTYRVTVTVKTGTSNGTVLENSAVITKLGDKTVNIVSNTVSTIVSSNEFVFYAEVGQKTSLPITLGKTEKITYKTEMQEKSATYTIVANRKSTTDADSGSGSATVNIPAGATVRIGGAGGAFMFDGGTSVTIGANSWQLTYGNKDNTYTTNGTVYYVDANVCGFASENAYVELKNLTASGDVNVTLNFAKMWAQTLEFTLTVIYSEEAQVPDSIEYADDVFKTIPTTTDKEATVDANGSVGQNSGTLLYTSKATGKDTFDVTYNPGGNTSETKTAKVTVYNYQVKNHVYVLDYGLPVNLTDKSAGNKSGLLEDAVYSLAADGDNAGATFTGLAENKQNTNGTADPGDYSAPDGTASSLTLSNGTAKCENTTDIENLKVTFTPESFMSAVNIFYYGVQVTKEGTENPSDATNATPVMEGEIKVMPANVVYYEDNFSKSGTNEADGTNGIIYTGTNPVDQKGTTFQWQTNDQDSPYGYDEEAYKNAINQYSNGNAHNLSIGATASFTFKGTGFDIIGRTNNATGIIMAMIYSVGENNTETFNKFIVVDTYYENGDLYQIPVVSVLDLSYGTYKVVLYSMRGYADEYAGLNGASTVYVDGVRIYNPLGVEGNEGYLEEEQGAQFVEVKSMIFGSNFNYDRNEPQNSTWTGDSPKDVMATLVKYDVTEDVYLNGSTLVEVLKDRNNAGEAVETAPSGTYDLLTYAFSGPNKELYLEDGYGFGFEPTKLKDDATLQIGVKLISKSDNASADPSIEYLDGNGEWQALCTVDSSTEKYYSLDELLANLDENLLYGLVVLRVNDNHSGAIVSVTNIKYKNYEFGELTTEYNGSPTIELKSDAISAKAGYNSKAKQFKASSITLAVTTKTDIREVIVYSDENGSTPMTLLSMTYKDKKDVRTWTVKFKGVNVQANYWVQIVDEFGQVSNLAKAGA